MSSLVAPSPRHVPHSAGLARPQSGAPGSSSSGLPNPARVLSNPPSRQASQTRLDTGKNPSRLRPPSQLTRLS